MAAAVVQEAPLSDEEIYQKLESYSWDDDAEFQAGLAAILGANVDPDQADRLAMRARCFYYARKNPGVNVDFPAYIAWREARHAASAGSEQPPPYPMSFAQIVELIQNEAPIPGIMDIPNTLLEGQSTASMMESRRKPWERNSAGANEETAGTDSRGAAHSNA